MVLVERRGLAARSAQTSSRLTRRKKKPYKIILETVTQEKKKLRSAVSYEATSPQGYTFVPAGVPDLSEFCKELCRKRGLVVHIVSATPKNKASADPEKISHHIHRIGYHFPNAVVDQACDWLGYSARGGTYRKDLDVVSTSRLARSLAGHSKRLGLDKRTGSEQENKAQVKAAIRDLFPKIPDEDLQEIIRHAFRAGTSRVGNAAELPLPRRVQLAVVAHIRHVYTDYDKLLKVGTYLDARAKVEQACLNQLVEWRGENDDGETELEDAFRETIVIEDDDDDDSEDDVSILGDERGQSLEISHRQAAAQDLQPEEYAPLVHHGSPRSFRAPRRIVLDGVSYMRPITQPQPVQSQGPIYRQATDSRIRLRDDLHSRPGQQHIPHPSDRLQPRGNVVYVTEGEPSRDVQVRRRVQAPGQAFPPGPEVPLSHNRASWPTSGASNNPQPLLERVVYRQPIPTYGYTEASRSRVKYADYPQTASHSIVPQQQARRYAEYAPQGSQPFRQSHAANHQKAIDEQDQPIPSIEHDEPRESLPPLRESQPEGQGHRAPLSHGPASQYRGVPTIGDERYHLDSGMVYTKPRYDQKPEYAYNLRERRVPQHREQRYVLDFPGMSQEDVHHSHRNPLVYAHPSENPKPLPRQSDWRPEEEEEVMANATSRTFDRFDAIDLTSSPQSRPGPKQRLAGQVSHTRFVSGNPGVQRQEASTGYQIHEGPVNGSLETLPKQQGDFQLREKRAAPQRAKGSAQVPTPSMPTNHPGVQTHRIGASEDPIVIDETPPRKRRTRFGGGTDQNSRSQHGPSMKKKKGKRAKERSTAKDQAQERPKPLDFDQPPLPRNSGAVNREGIPGNGTAAEHYVAENLYDNY